MLTLASMHSCVFAVVFLIQMASCIEAPKMRLNNGIKVPRISLGTYLGFGEKGVVEPTSDFVDVIARAIDIGWRHFDTAWIYKTEAAVGEGIRRKIADGTIQRSDVFVTTKLWNNRHRKEEVIASLRDTLNQMGLDYVDLFLMHWPMGLNDDGTPTDTHYLESWQGMEEAQALGLTRAIGVSNFNRTQLATDDGTPTDTHYLESWQGMEDAQALGLTRAIGVSNFNRTQLATVIEEGVVKPAVLQIEVHLQNTQRELVSYAQAQGVAVMGYSPFGSLVARHGKTYPGPKLNNSTLLAIARKYGKTVPQIVLRWLVQRDIIPIAKTTKLNRLEENLDIFDFELDREEMEKLYNFDTRTRYTFPSFWQSHPYYPFEKVNYSLKNPFLKN